MGFFGNKVADKSPPKKVLNSKAWEGFYFLPFSSGLGLKSALILARKALYMTFQAMIGRMRVGAYLILVYRMGGDGGTTFGPDEISHGWGSFFFLFNFSM